MRAKRSMRGARKRRKRARAPPAATTGKRGEKPMTSPSIAPNEVMAERPRRIFIEDRECMLVGLVTDSILMSQENIQIL